MNYKSRKENKIRKMVINKEKIKVENDYDIFFQ